MWKKQCIHHSLSENNVFFHSSHSEAAKEKGRCRSCTRHTAFSALLKGSACTNLSAYRLVQKMRDTLLVLLSSVLNVMWESWKCQYRSILHWTWQEIWPQLLYVHTTKCVSSLKLKPPKMYNEHICDRLIKNNFNCFFKGNYSSLTYCNVSDCQLIWRWGWHTGPQMWLCGPVKNLKWASAVLVSSI